MKTVITASDLVTSVTERIKGFQWQAQQKAALGNQFFAIADHFASKAPSTKSVVALWSDPKLKEFALAAASLSNKSLSHISDADQQKIVTGIIDFAKLSVPTYVVELQRRYLLTCGDSLGGSMRNIVGQTAQKKLTELICYELARAGFSHTPQTNAAGKITGIMWKNGKGDRQILFDRKVNFIGKNIDFIVLQGTYDKEDLHDYIACGELKGGIDPAGADEHWKTARSALERIRGQFVSKGVTSPPLFFVAAAIESSMAKEVFAELSAKTLTAAANLTSPLQMEELVTTLINL
jgi:hypothetical protein